MFAYKQICVTQMRVVRYTRVVSRMLAIGVTSLFPAYPAAQTCYNVGYKR